ncbi:MAG: hypothetical protein M1834_003124 [Cirrosporium novae-zelandiae]|nr:MAG: hypothetical protein M1834_003124 [Cirrosporium novae-zelandiae]
MSARISIDWRTKTQSTTLVNKLHRLLTELDREGSAMIEISDSKAKGMVRLVKVDEANNDDENGEKHIWARYKKGCKKGTETQQQKQYWATIIVVIRQMLSRLAYHAQENERKVGYELRRPGLTAERANKLLKDIAITIGVHPISLGVIPESQGEVSIPSGWKLAAMTISNVFEYSAREGGGTRVETLTERRQIPMPTISTTLRRAKGYRGPIVAVVVVEHRNIKQGLDRVAKGENCLRDIIFVMTAGYPDQATREFLVCLSRDETLKDVPFLFFADHDANGFEIYLTLKMGSKNMAWASQSQACGRLTYAGPTMGDIESSITRMAPEGTDPVATIRKFRKYASNSQSCRIFPKGLQVLRRIRADGLLQNEEKLALEVETMISTEYGAYGLAALTWAHRQFGVEQFFVHSISQLIAVPMTNSMPEIVTYSQQEAMDALSSVVTMENTPMAHVTPRQNALLNVAAIPDPPVISEEVDPSMMSGAIATVEEVRERLQAIKRARHIYRNII